MPIRILDLSLADQVTTLYLAYFGRSPDAPGLRFWTEEAAAALADGRDLAGTLRNVAESFRLSEESRSTHPVLAPDATPPADAAIRDFISDVYINLFDRPPEDAGLAFWTDEIRDRLEKGGALGDVVVDMIAGARGADADTVRDKIAGGGAGDPPPADRDDDVGNRPDNAPPRPALDVVTLREGGKQRFNVLDNDRDPDGDALSAIRAGPVEGGDLMLSRSGNALFDAEGEYNGVQQVTYEVSDGNGGRATGTIEIRVIGVNDPPEAVTDLLAAAPGERVVFDPLANDRDPDGATPRLLAVDDSEAGTVARLPDGRVAFTADPGASGHVGFTYTVVDDAGATATGRVDIDLDAGPEVATGRIATPPLDVAFADDPALAGLEDEITATLERALSNWTRWIETADRAAIEMQVGILEDPQPGVLAAGGSSFVFGDAPRRTVAQEELIAGEDANGTLPDASLFFPSARLADLNFGTDGITPGRGPDAEVILTHEIGHALGFLGNDRESTWGALVAEDPALGTVFTGAAATAANGGEPVALEPGSAHLLDDAFRGALMAPVLRDATPAAPGEVELAILEDLGFTLRDDVFFGA